MLTPQPDAKATSVWPAQYMFVFANAFTCGVYLVRASYGWRIPEEHGMIPITGEPFVWFGGIAPVLIVSFVLNAFWIALIMNRK